MMNTAVTANSQRICKAAKAFVAADTNLACEERTYVMNKLRKIRVGNEDTCFDWNTNNIKPTVKKRADIIRKNIGAFSR